MHYTPTWRTLLRLPLRLMAAGLLLTATACEDDDDEVVPSAGPTILELATTSPNLDVLQAAVTRAGSGLANALNNRSSNLTVFAPTDEAFQEFLGASNEANAIASINALPPAAVQFILEYHVLGEERFASSLAASGQLQTLAQGEGGTSLPIFLRVVNNQRRLNASNVTTADIAAENGVVHLIDAVLTPPNGTLVDVVVEDEANRFDVLTAALTRAGLVPTLSGAGPFTVFAPTDEAFELLFDNSEAAILTSIETMSQEDFDTDIVPVLQLHVLADNAVVFANDITATTVGVATLNTGNNISVQTTTNGVEVTDPSAGTSVVTEANLNATNGVVHVIDRVLQP